MADYLSTHTGAETDSAIGFVLDQDTNKSLTGDTGYQIFAGGLVMQWGTVVTNTDGTGSASITFPITFPTAIRTLIVGNGDSTYIGGIAVKNATVTDSGADFQCSSLSATVRTNFVAMGY
jgi:hypothetical protein